MPTQLKRKTRGDDSKAATTPSQRRNAGVSKHAQDKTRAPERSRSSRVSRKTELKSQIENGLVRSQSTIFHKPDCAASTPQEQPEIRLTRHTSIKRPREDDEIRTPETKRFKNIAPLTPDKTPKKNPEDSAVKSLFKLPVHSIDLQAGVYSTPPLTPSQGCSEVDDLPEALQDLSNMSSSFMSAISLFLAHNGLSSSLDLGDILRQTMQSWGKRKVSVVDTQRLLGLLNAGGPILNLVGSGSACNSTTIRLEPAKHSISTIVTNQHVLSSHFNTRLCRRWDQWLATADSDSVDEFIASLPLSEVQPDKTSSSDDATRISKGMSRLNLLRQDSKRARHEAEAGQKASIIAAEAKTSAAVQSRGTSLLDRVLAKERLLASSPRPPTKEELERNAALDRIEEAAMTLGLLAASKPRVSFSMQMAVKHLQDSMRNPISRQEAELCLNLMATHVAPEFVSLVKMEGLSGVVVKRSGRPSTLALKEALREARS